ncbi:tRNA uridine-5-carboxymethylaminomethyl(34) synthesis GTPase MnmE [Blattabacterium cuenoti]|uniref:tRNA uridine-5-carboxymethylaminomethyl(34) synthesis GTPase MnmE n=1 Tax=Blattabacterium cuenoti TaxID=1653831 RepID=UPI00163B7597|nr:tRNA uridine-5-carboxymethylaminomethyl(34) synthesis GTPase MnmE [Blattabacterium cuenoti]
MHYYDDHTIVALATPIGPSAISIIRISGKDSISIINNIFFSIKIGKNLEDQSTHTIHLGYIRDVINDNNTTNTNLDKVLVSIFKSPFSYTGENMIEISCHGSYYIQQQILNLLIRKGMRLAHPGEFTFRAFMNKKLDLSQAEAISDLISSGNKTLHDISFQQVKGSISNYIKNLRKKLLHLSSLLEVELDFYEENMISCKKSEICDILLGLKCSFKKLVESFSLGNAIKSGIYVVIIGETNVGKSTIFNKIIQEERSIISPIEGTTRDFIEGSIVINGILFRFLDTAGIRNTNDYIENIGIEKTLIKVEESQVILYILDSTIKKIQQKKIVNDIQNLHIKYPDKTIFSIANKSDISSFKDFYNIESKVSYFFEISANNYNGIQKILNTLGKVFIEKLKSKKTVITQSRHYEVFKHSLKEISLAYKAFNKGFSEEIISIHIKQVLHYLGKITGEITSEEILNNIFSKFCIGK